MIIAAVQCRSEPDAITTNTRKHLSFVELASSHGAGLVAFPELSLTSYEPTLADQISLHSSDAAFDIFARASHALDIIIAIGVPIKTAAKPTITQLFFHPDGRRQYYAKQHLHADEQAYFSAGGQTLLLQTRDACIAPAICYEATLPEHCNAAVTAGATVYLASVAKTRNAVSSARTHFARIAKQHAITVLMANAVGVSDNVVNAGASAAWCPNGNLVAELDRDVEALITIDTQTHTARTEFLS